MQKLLLIFLILTSILQAGELFSKLPYGIQMRKEVPPEVNRMMEKYGKHSYLIEGKFSIFISDETIFSLKFLNYQEVQFPKKWRRTKMRLCSKYREGSSIEKMKNIFLKDGAFEDDNKYDEDEYDIDFIVDDNKRYTLTFLLEPTYNCKGGLKEIVVHSFSPSNNEY